MSGDEGADVIFLHSSLLQEIHHCAHLLHPERRVRIPASLGVLVLEPLPRLALHLQRVDPRDADGLEVLVHADLRLLLRHAVDALHALAPGAKPRLGDGRDGARARRTRRGAPPPNGHRRGGEAGGGGADARGHPGALGKRETRRAHHIDVECLCVGDLRPRNVL